MDFNYQTPREVLRLGFEDMQWAEVAALRQALIGEECWRTVMGGAGWGLQEVALRAGISAVWSSHLHQLSDRLVYKRVEPNLLKASFSQISKLSHEKTDQTMLTKEWQLGKLPPLREATFFSDTCLCSAEPQAKSKAIGLQSTFYHSENSTAEFSK